MDQSQKLSVLAAAFQDNTQESAVLGSEFIGTFYIVLTQVPTKSCLNHADLSGS
jgi:hypothetical protein